MNKRLAVAVVMILVTGFGVSAAPSVLAAQPAATTATAHVHIVPSSSTCSFFCFKPGRLQVTGPTQVTWTNQTSVTHTITRCTPAACSGRSGGTGTDAGFGTSSLSPNQQYTFTFNTPGTYVYYCAIHGYSLMHAKVTVH